MKTIKDKLATLVLCIAVAAITYFGIRVLDKYTSFETKEPALLEDTCEHEHTLVKPSSKSVKLATDIIKEFEGYSELVYICPAGKQTIGYGFTDKPSLLKEPMSKELANDLLTAKVADLQIRLIKDFELYNARQPNDNELAAFSCLVYNIGWTNWKVSTCRDLWVTGKDKELVAKEFGRWVYCKKRVLRGLQRRRQVEADLFLKK